MNQKESLKRNFKKMHRTKSNLICKISKLGGLREALLRGKSIARKTHIRKEENSYISNQSSYFKNLQKKE